MSAALVVAFSDLLNKPKDTLASMARSGAVLLRLRRRDAEDLVLTTASRREQNTPRSSSRRWLYAGPHSSPPRSPHPWPGGALRPARHAFPVRLAQRRVSPQQVAEWAGHSLAVLLHVYATCVDG